MKTKISILIGGIWRAIKRWIKKNNEPYQRPPSYHPTEDQHDEIERLTKRLERRNKENEILKKPDTSRSIRG